MRRVTVESSLQSCLHLNNNVTMTSSAISSANDNNSLIEASHYWNSDSIVVMLCVSVLVLSEQNMSIPQVQTKICMPQLLALW